MAIAKGGVILAPSNDIRTKAELDSVTVEAGIFHVSEEVTINGVTSSKWTVLCFSNELQQSIQCYSQLWISVQQNLKPRLFIRTAIQGANDYSDFTSFVNCGTSSPVELYVGGTEPVAESGVTKLYIDLN